VTDPTSGIAVVDELLDGVRVGDNLVFQGAAGVPLSAFASAFADAVPDPARLVRVAVAAPWEGPAPRAGVVLDWYRGRRRGRIPAEVRRLRPSADAAAARAMLEEADAEVGAEATFVIDSLTAVQGAWGADAALDLFLWACPRLYRRGSLALWLVDRDEHSPRFLTRLQDITQVVLDFTVAADATADPTRGPADGAADGVEVDIEVAKADGRPQTFLGRRARARVGDGGIVTTGAIVSGRERLGGLIRTHRTSHGLSQAELARRIGITPSALSQVERGVRGLSAESLMRIWETLGVPFGPDDTHHRGYRVARRGAQVAVRLAEGVAGRQALGDPDAGQIWELTLDPGASGRLPLFAVKAAEIVVVRHGVIDLEVGGHPETLQEGDVLVAGDAPIGAWANPTGQPTEVQWLIQPR
jgi:transcriptional regulator with XRE-family HTH domain